MKKHKGILAQIKDEANTYDASKITPENIVDSLKCLMNIKPQKEQRQYVLYTGWKGYNNFNFALKFGESFEGKWWINHFHHRSLLKYDTYLSVVRKHSLYKVQVILENYEYRFLLLKGTKMIASYSNIKALNKKLHLLNKRADQHDAQRECERQYRIAKRELEGKLRLIEKRYE